MTNDSERFDAWYRDQRWDLPAGTWIAVDPGMRVIDQDGNGNELLARVQQKAPDPSLIRIVYSFPREFV